MRHYAYVGPLEIRKAACIRKSGTLIDSLHDLQSWLAGHQDEFSEEGSLTATFVIDREGRFKLAPRRSEHVACAEGVPVLSAGEITISKNCEVIAVTNQSTGYCPEPESWPAVMQTLDRMNLIHPGEFTLALLFRRCPQCGEINIIKEEWFVCAVCEADLPTSWNCDEKASRDH